MKSIWSDTVSLSSFNQLQGDISTDVLIIGGGIAGILCAYMLEQEGIDYVLAEADRICGGVTKNTTAKITIQHGLIYHKLVKKYGIERAAMYLEANKVALEQFMELSKGIDCRFEKKDSFVYSLDKPELLEQEINALEKIGYSAEYTDHVPLPFSTAGAVKFPEQAQFHPLKFLSHIAKGLHIYEHTMVQELSDGIAITPHGKITASKIIVATHFPFLNWHGSYFLKMYQHRSYVLALENAPDVNGIYVDEADNGLSFRNHENLLFIGGGDHRTGKRGGNWEELSRFARKHYPFAPVFSPSRSMLYPQLAVNTFETLTNLLSVSTKRCPHMGCALKWNPQEHTWDCPCHGSRFTEKGKLINNPATRDLKNP